TDRSILDWITHEVASLKRDLGPTDRSRLDQYLEDVREVERRIQRIEEHNLNDPAQISKTPVGIPTLSKTTFKSCSISRRWPSLPVSHGSLHSKCRAMQRAVHIRKAA